MGSCTTLKFMKQHPCIQDARRHYKQAVEKGAVALLRAKVNATKHNQRAREAFEDALSKLNDFEAKTVKRMASSKWDMNLRALGPRSTPGTVLSIGLLGLGASSLMCVAVSMRKRMQRTVHYARFLAVDST